MATTVSYAESPTLLLLGRDRTECARSRICELPHMDQGRMHAWPTLLADSVKCCLQARRLGLLHKHMHRAQPRTPTPAAAHSPHHRRPDNASAAPTNSPMAFTEYPTAPSGAPTCR